MSRRADFLLAVQAILLRREEATDVMVVVLERAFALREESVPEKPAQAALEFVRHAAMPIAYPAPEWLAAHDEASLTPSVILRVRVSAWWDGVAESGYEHAVPADLHPFLARDRAAMLTSRANAAVLLDWATTLPGWDYDAPAIVVEQLEG